MEDQRVVVAAPALSDRPALEDDMVDPPPPELMRDRQAGRAGTDDDDGGITPGLHDGLPGLASNDDRWRTDDDRHA